jgi:hypothetical protein
MVTWERIAALARELPEVEESSSCGKPALRLRGSAFCRPVAPRRGDVDSLRSGGAAAARRVESAGLRLTLHFERSPAYLLIWLEHVREDELHERLLDAWLLAAAKRLAAAFAAELERQP